MIPRSLMACALALLSLNLHAQLQSLCTSDGVPAPSALVERYLSADCADCWKQGQAPATGALALDWVLPGQQADDAPLAPVATRDAQTRLAASTLPSPTARKARQTQLPNTATLPSLRVAMGPAVGDYVAASISFAPPHEAGPWSVWLALVQDVPSGTEGTPVPRLLVRNLLMLALDKENLLSVQESEGFREVRAMRFPEGVARSQLRVVGWIEDSLGRMDSIAVSVCPKDTDSR